MRNLSCAIGKRRSSASYPCGNGKRRKRRKRKCRKARRRLSPSPTRVSPSWQRASSSFCRLRRTATASVAPPSTIGAPAAAQQRRLLQEGVAFFVRPSPMECGGSTTRNRNSRTRRSRPPGNTVPADGASPQSGISRLISARKLLTSTIRWRSWTCITTLIPTWTFHGRWAMWPSRQSPRAA